MIEWHNMTILREDVLIKGLAIRISSKQLKFLRSNIVNVFKIPKTFEKIESKL